MIEWIKQKFCKHQLEIIEDDEWLRPHWQVEKVYREKRKYMVCLKCGYKRKISKK